MGIRDSYKAEDPTTNILGSYDIDYERVSKEYQTMLKNSGQNPKMSAYDDDEEREEYGQMRKPTGNIGSGKSKTPTPVSYTHLDVYKRQSGRSLPRNFTLPSSDKDFASATYSSFRGPSPHIQNSAPRMFCIATIILSSPRDGLITP